MPLGINRYVHVISKAKVCVLPLFQERLAHSYKNIYVILKRICVCVYSTNYNYTHTSEKSNLKWQGFFVKWKNVSVSRWTHLHPISYHEFILVAKFCACQFVYFCCCSPLIFSFINSSVKHAKGLNCPLV